MKVLSKPSFYDSTDEMKSFYDFVRAHGWWEGDYIDQGYFYQAFLCIKNVFSF